MRIWAGRVARHADVGDVLACGHEVPSFDVDLMANMWAYPDVTVWPSRSSWFGLRRLPEAEKTTLLVSGSAGGSPSAPPPPPGQCVDDLVGDRLEPPVPVGVRRVLNGLGCGALTHLAPARDVEEAKEKAIAKTTPQDADAGRYQPPDPVLSFLANL